MSRPAARCHIGTSGWITPRWRGRFYPEGLADDAWLGLYSARFDSVEVNNAFYRLPDAGTLRGWRSETPPDFVFAVKASRYITHMKKLKEAPQPLSRFFDRIGALGGQRGVVLFQLPPCWRVNLKRLETFLDALAGVGSDCHCAFEFRDRSWFDERVYELLARHNCALCSYHLAGKQSPREVTADFVYVRLHGPADAYQGCYDDTTLAGWAGAFSTWRRQGRAVFCYLDNDQEGYAARDAARLKDMLECARRQCADAAGGGAKPSAWCPSPGAEAAAWRRSRGVGSGAARSIGFFCALSRLNFR